jgi:hypothetical protein
MRNLHTAVNAPFSLNKLEAEGFTVDGVATKHLGEVEHGFDECIFGEEQWDELVGGAALRGMGGVVGEELAVEGGGESDHVKHNVGLLRCSLNALSK